MMSRIESDYFRKTLTTYYPLDWDLVLRSDWHGQLHWPGIVFPRDVLDPECLTRTDLQHNEGLCTSAGWCRSMQVLMAQSRVGVV